MNFTHQAKRGKTLSSWGKPVFGILLVILFFFAFPYIRPADAAAPNVVFRFDLMLACFFLAWILASISSRQYFHVDDDSVEYASGFGKKIIALDQVTEAHWNPGGNDGRGQLDLHSANAMISIPFAIIPADDVCNLALFFHRRLPESVQKGWEKYWERRWPMFDERENLSPEELASARRASRRFFLRWCFIGWIFLAIGDFIAWRYTDEPKWLAQPLIVFVFAPLYFVFPRYFVPTTKGRIAQHRPKPKLTTIEATGILLAVCSPFLVLASRIFPHNSALEGVFSILPIFIFMIPVLWSFKKNEKTVQQWNREAAKRAAELYLPSSSDSVKTL